MIVNCNAPIKALPHLPHAGKSWGLGRDLTPNMASDGRVSLFNNTMDLLHNRHVLYTQANILLDFKSSSSSTFSEQMGCRVHMGFEPHFFGSKVIII